MDGEPVGFRDRRLGDTVEVGGESGDFVLLGADGYCAYQLAVVVDDAWQGITDVVRGEDLLDSTPRQIRLQRALGLPAPSYFHLPMARTPQGDKLSKQTRASALDDSRPIPQLEASLQFLGYPPPPDMSVAELLQWAVGAWHILE